MGTPTARNVAPAGSEYEETKHKDPVGTALHIQEPNMNDTIQTSTSQNALQPATQLQRNERRAKKRRERFRLPTFILGTGTWTDSSIPYLDLSVPCAVIPGSVVEGVWPVREGPKAYEVVKSRNTIG
ncbi:hypothetical protein TNCV_3955861 [Trichonephila clavipes]|nr:hypothetical protein TNCV_3955861 [Trichonephila clavipes]